MSTLAWQALMVGYALAASALVLLGAQLGVELHRRLARRRSRP